MAKKEVEEKKKLAKEAKEEKKELKKAKKEEKVKTKDKKETKEKVPKEKKEGLLKGIVKEIKQVNFASGKEMVKYVIATIVFIVLLALFFQLMDVVSSFVKGLF